MAGERVLITGGGGQLARELAVRIPGSHSLDRRELSITNLDDVRSALRTTGASLVFNCAAYNGVDLAEVSPEEAFAVNADGAANVARACQEARARLVHYSTNYVFAGDRVDAYSESDPADPPSAYGRSKREGEIKVIQNLPDALVIRSSGLFGHRGSAIKGGSFPDRIVARAREGQELRVVDDQFLNPTYTGHLAAASIEAIELGTTGIVHLVAAGCCSFFEFATEILRVAGITTEIRPIRTGQSPGGAPRPRNGCLRSDRMAPLPDWRVGLADFWVSRPVPGG